MPKQKKPSIPAGTFCPFLNKICIGYKCKMWLMEMDAVHVKEGECGLLRTQYSIIEAIEMLVERKLTDGKK